MDDMHLPRVKRILAKLRQVRSGNLSCFGSEKHRFMLNPPAAEGKVRAFETAHGVRLPADYRAFLTQAGNGGAGPYYGIYPLDMWSDFADWVMDDRPPDFLARPCPLTPSMDRSEDWAKPYGDASPYQGTLTLGTQGCAFSMLLIVSGHHAGRVVYVDADGTAPYVVGEPDFLAWYERWLDELLGGYKIDWFGYGPGGGENDFFRTLEDPHTSDAEKAEAAHAIVRLPGLSSSGAAQIVAYCRHPVAGVRAGACSVIEAFALRVHADEAARLLVDPAPGVRCHAVRAVMKLDPRRWTGAVLSTLHDETDQDAAQTEYFLLKEAGALTKPELLRIIDLPDVGARYLAVSDVAWAPDDVSRLVRLLSDPNSQVRHYAMLGLRKVGRRGAAPSVLELLRRETDELVIDAALQALGDFGDRSVVAALLEWATVTDDFHRLKAMESLAKLGDPLAAPIAASMLREHRPPVRKSRDGVGFSSHVETISALVAKALAASPSRVLRMLAKKR